jgi:hypothetical protein
MDEEDRLNQHLEDITKRVERAVHARIQQLSDYLTTLYNDLQEIKQRQTNLELALNISSKNSMFVNRSVTLLTQEIDALEHYLAKSDPNLKSLLLQALMSKKQELKNRNLPDYSDPNTNPLIGPDQTKTNDGLPKF